MSATPEVPLLASAMDAGIKVQFIKRTSLRTAKRFIAWDKRPLDTTRAPPRSITFTTIPRDVANEHVCEKFLNSDFNPPRADRIRAHPTYVFGYNPKINVNLGIIDFSRMYMAATTDPGVLTIAHKTDIEYENFIQAIGRLTRHYDSGAIMITSGVTQIAPLRFQPPRFPTCNNMYEALKENYEARTKPQSMLNERKFMPFP